MIELDAVIERVREVIQEAEAAGEQPPGRPTLVKLTGLSEYQVRRAQEELAKAGDEEPPATSSESPADPDGGPETAEMPAVTEPEPVELEPAGDELETLDIQEEAAGETDLQPVEPVRQRAQSSVAARLAGVQWPLLVIGLAAAVAVWSGWVGLGTMSGFGVIQPLPGIVDDLRINTAVVLPVSVEAYGAYALRIWLGSAGRSPRTVRYAMVSSVASLAIGAGAQVAYHLMAAAGMTRAPWQITMLVACVPVVVLGLAAALAHMVSSDLQATSSAGGER